jgi:hypothetical protein
MTQPPYGPPPHGQDPYGQPPYGQPPRGQQYGQPEMGPMTTRFAMVDPGPSSSFGLVGAGIAALGLVLGLVSFLALDWVSGANGSGTFSDLHELIDQLGSDALPGDTAMYFSWLGWVLLIGATVLAFLACLPGPVSVALRVLGFLAGLAGIGLTIWAIKGSDDWGQVFDDKGAGFYLALAAFLLIAVGALIGPRRSRA